MAFKAIFLVSSYKIKLLKFCIFVELHLIGPPVVSSSDGPEASPAPVYVYFARSCEPYKRITS